MQQHPNVKVKYLAEYCFSGTYILTLLTEGYNFTSETYSNINFIKKVSGRSHFSSFMHPWVMPPPNLHHTLLSFNL